MMYRATSFLVLILGICVTGLAQTRSDVGKRLVREISTLEPAELPRQSRVAQQFVDYPSIVDSCSFRVGVSPLAQGGLGAFLRGPMDLAIWRKLNN